MRTPFHLRILVPVLVLGLLALVPVTASAQTKTDVENAKTAEDQAFASLIEVDQKLEDELYELEDIDGQIYNLEWRISKLETALSEYSSNVDLLEDRAKLIVYEAYTSGGRNMVTSAFSANDIQDLITTQALLDAATTRDLSQLDQLAAVGRQMDRLNEDLGIKEAEVQELRSEQETLIGHLEEDRAAADKLHEEAKRKYADTYEKYKAEQARIAAEKAAAAARAAAAAAAPDRRVARRLAGPDAIPCVGRSAPANRSRWSDR